MLESTETSRFSSSTASAITRTFVTSVVRVPPERYGPWKTVYNRFWCWSRNGRSRHATAVFALNSIPLITRRSSTRGRPFTRSGQQRLDHPPLLVGQLVPADHASISKQTDHTRFKNRL
jgi:hypothetical protein